MLWEGCCFNQNRQSSVLLASDTLCVLLVLNQNENLATIDLICFVLLLPITDHVTVL